MFETSEIPPPISRGYREDDNFPDTGNYIQSLLNEASQERNRQLEKKRKVFKSLAVLYKNYLNHFKEGI